MRLFTNWRHRKILFLISLPSTPVFQSCAKDIERCIEQLKKQKVDVCESIDHVSLSSISRYEIVIVLAHRAEQEEALELADRTLSLDEFVSSLPADFSGVLDFSSCYAASAMSAIKERCPQCHILAPVQQTTLPLRLIMYPHIVELLNQDRKAQYIDIYEEVLREIVDIHFSIYAPSSVKREHPFIVQIYFHEAENDLIQMEARRVDPETGLVESNTLPIKLKKKDKICIRMSFISPQKECIRIEDGMDTKAAIWLGGKTKIVFCATAGSSFTESSFVTKLQIEVNSMPIGESYFTIKVAEKEEAAPTGIYVQAHDFEAERNAAKEQLRNKLLNNLLHLQEYLSHAPSGNARKSIENSIQVCTACIEVLERQRVSDINTIRKVFVSSTSDMKEYREILRKEIETCNMFPEMYEHWPQTDLTPKEECCRRVISSDVFYCILGAKYGYIEPTLGMSMTEFEYRTALEAGKRILVSIIDPLNETDEPHEKKLRQLELIDEIRNTRILKFFSDSISLAQNAARDLSRIETVQL